jgi:uncharacterized protein
MISITKNSIEQIMLTQNFENIRKAIQDVPVINTHDHLLPYELIHIPMTVMELFRSTYIYRCLRNSDGSGNGIGNRTNWAILDSRWETVQTVVQKVKLTAYYRCLLGGLIELYNLPDTELTLTSYNILSEKLDTNYKNPAWIGQVLDRSNIRTVLWDPYWKPGVWETPDQRVIPSMDISSSLPGFHPGASDYEGTNIIRDWAPYFNLAVDSLQDLEDLIEKILQKNLEAGARSLKSPIAYDRSLAVGPGLRKRAQEIFGTPAEIITPQERIEFGDYIIRLYLEYARQKGLVFQVHTGGARLNDSNPLLMTTLLEQYPGVIFDIFHGGYPWFHEVGALAHNYPNVRLNLSWLHQLSRESAVFALKEWLQVAPQTGRITWGGDVRLVEEMFGSLLMIKYVISRALADLVDDGYINLEDAIETAQNILYQNGKEIYHLERDLLLQ